jgi:hypothetical protein
MEFTSSLPAIQGFYLANFAAASNSSEVNIFQIVGLIFIHCYFNFSGLIAHMLLIIGNNLSSLFINVDPMVGGLRPAPVIIPPNYNPSTPTPLLILLHGYSANGLMQESYLFIKKVAKK